MDNHAPEHNKHLKLPTESLVSSIQAEFYIVMRRLWKAMLGALSWDKVINLVNEHKLEEALENLYKIPTDTVLGVQVFLMMGVCHLNLDQKVLAITASSEHAITCHNHPRRDEFLKTQQ